MKKSIVLASIVLIALSFLIPRQGLSQDVVEKRQELMDSNYKAMKAIRVAAKEKDYATLQVDAKVIIDNMGKLLDLFPEGSTSENAHPNIWKNWDEFSKGPGKVKAAAEAIAKAAAAKDDAQLKVQVKALGGMRSGGCGGCHVSFNKKRMKKGKSKKK